MRLFQVTSALKMPGFSSWSFQSKSPLEEVNKGLISPVIFLIDFFFFSKSLIGVSYIGIKSEKGKFSKLDSHIPLAHLAVF
jgi:hypothetical protein